jgi:hypothetical protein
MEAGSVRHRSVGEGSPPRHNLLKDIDKNLPPIKLVSLAEWGTIWTELANAGNDRERDIFALTGHFVDPETGVTHRSKIDFSQQKTRAQDCIGQVCDVDSMIGIVLKDFPIQPAVTLKYFILASALHSLSTNLHIPPIRVADDDGSEEVSA